MLNKEFLEKECLNDINFYYKIINLFINEFIDYQKSINNLKNDIKNNNYLIKKICHNFKSSLLYINNPNLQYIISKLLYIINNDDLTYNNLIEEITNLDIKNLIQKYY